MNPIFPRFPMLTYENSLFSNPHVLTWLYSHLLKIYLDVFEKRIIVNQTNLYILVILLLGKQTMDKPFSESKAWLLLRIEYFSSKKTLTAATNFKFTPSHPFTLFSFSVLPTSYSLDYSILETSLIGLLAVIFAYN